MFGRTNLVAVVFGALWMFDGLLQLQPSQFGSSVAIAIEENAMAEPHWLADLYLTVGRLLAPESSLINVAIALVQVGLGILILRPRSRRIGLIASLPWALAVWGIGEGFGNLATGFATPIAGAPGAALLYGVLAVALLVTVDAPVTRQKEAELQARQLLRWTWFVLWIGGATEQLAPVSLGRLRYLANLHESASEAWPDIARADDLLATTFASHVGVATSGLVLIYVALALGPFVRAEHCRNAAVAVAFVLAAIWVFGEDFGGLLTGSGNDVGTMPLFLLILVHMSTIARPLLLPQAPEQDALQFAMSLR